MIDEQLVRDLLREQFPQWAALPLRPVGVRSNDHRIFRLGDRLSVRLPVAERVFGQVEKEQAWLPRIAEHASLEVPAVHGAGRPGPLFAGPWSVYEWIDGAPAGAVAADDPVAFAADLARFLVTLRSVPTAGAPGPGLHSFFRGAPLADADAEVTALLSRVHGRERDLAAAIWRDALAAVPTGPGEWFHGDVSVSNLLVRGGALAAVIDFGCAAVGDPACDTGILWTHLGGRAREVFRRELDADDATWARGRGLALWKGLIMITNKPPGQAELARHVLDELFAAV